MTTIFVRDYLYTALESIRHFVKIFTVYQVLIVIKCDRHPINVAAVCWWAYLR